MIGRVRGGDAHVLEDDHAAGHGVAAAELHPLWSCGGAKHVVEADVVNGDSSVLGAAHRVRDVVLVAVILRSRGVGKRGGVEER